MYFFIAKRAELKWDVQSLPVTGIYLDNLTLKQVVTPQFSMQHKNGNYFLMWN